MLRIGDVVGLAAGALVLASSFGTQFEPVTTLRTSVAPPCSVWTTCAGASLRGDGDLTQVHGVLAVFAIAACLLGPLGRLWLYPRAWAPLAGLQVAGLVGALTSLAALGWYSTSVNRWIGYAEWNHEFSLRTGVGLYGMVIGVAIALGAALADLERPDNRPDQTRPAAQWPA